MRTKEEIEKDWKDYKVAFIIIGILVIISLVIIFSLPNQACEINEDINNPRANLTYPIEFGFFDVKCPKYSDGGAFVITDRFNWLFAKV